VIGIDVKDYNIVVHCGCVKVSTTTLGTPWANKTRTN